MTRVLHECKFIPEDDFSYLSDDSKWIRRLSYRVTPEEMKEKVIPFLKILLNDLDQQPNKLDLIIEKVFSRGAEHTYLIEVKLSELDFNQRKEIEACFVASVIRYLILKTPAEKRDTSQAREEFRKRLVEDGVENSYADFMQNEVGSDIELTCLYRFERAVLIAKTYISGNRNKGLFLSVGSLLEGSDDFTKYITGGHASKETKRRVMIIERLCGIQPRKRMRKLAPESQKVQKEVAGSLLQFADIALSRETEDFSAIGLIAESKEDENMLYREYVGKKMATLNSVRIKVYNKESESLFYREVELLKKLNQRDCVVQMLGFFEEFKKDTNMFPSADMNKPIEVEKVIVYESGFRYRFSDLMGASVWTLAKVWVDLMEAVHFVHSHDMLIRNLKPSSVYLVGPVHNLRVKIGDFTFAERVSLESPMIASKDKQKKTKDLIEEEENKMDIDEIEDNEPLKQDETLKGLVPWKAEKEDVESRLDYALLKDFMFVAPDVFTKQAGFKADVWSLGLLGLFLVKHVIPWREVQYVQEKAEEAEEESEKKMREMLDGLSWVSEVSEDTEKEDIVMLGVLKRAIASCLHVSVKQRVSLLEVRNAVRQRVVIAKKARGEIMLRDRERRNVQSLGSFINCMKAVGTVSVFSKLKQEERIMYMESQTESKEFREPMVETEPSENKYRKMFRRLVHVVIAMHRFQKPQTSSGGSSSSKLSFSSPSSLPSSSTIPSSVSLADHSDKTLLNGRFTIISTFLRTADYECHLIHNNTSQRTQILKHIKVKNMQYENELLILRSMSNEVTISEVEDYVEDMYQKYVAVGWLEGGWLLNVLNDYQVAGQPMSEKCLQSVARGLVSAMKYLHGRGIIYRGLNLSRVLTKRVSEDEMMVKLWDFGPAILKDGAMLTSSVGSGYGGYAFPSTAPSAWMHYPEGGEDGYYCMAPELLRYLVYIDHKQKYDEKVDAWSVGMVLYLLVEGKSCFSVGDARSVLESIERWENGVINSNIPVNTLSFRNDLVSQGTKDVIIGLLKVLPKDRLSWTDELLLRWSGLKEINNPPNEYFMVENMVPGYGGGMIGSVSGGVGGLSWKGVGLPPGIAGQRGMYAPSMTPVWQSINPNYPNMSQMVSPFGHPSLPVMYSIPAVSSIPPLVARKSQLEVPPSESSSFLAGAKPSVTSSVIPKKEPEPTILTSFSNSQGLQSISNSTIMPTLLSLPNQEKERTDEMTVKDLLQKLQNMKEYHLKYVEYQSAILSDDFDKAERLSSELSDIDESELSDQNRFKTTYSTMLESLNNAMASWKEVVMKTPKLFEQYKEDSRKKKDLDNFLETLSSK
eukprot:gene11707-12776_t